MKRILCLIFALSMCLCLFSCGDDEVPDGMKLASDTSVVDYKLFVPEGWVVARAERASTQAYVSNTDRTNVIVVQWNLTENTKTLEDWWEKEYKPQVFTAEAVQDYTIEKDKDGKESVATTLDAKPAAKYSYTGRIGDTFFKFDVYACITRGSIYVVQVAYMQDSEQTDGKYTYSTVEKHKSTIDSIIANFKFD